MSGRDYKELWEQLRSVSICTCGKEVTWTSREIFDAMTLLEINQLTQDPIGNILKSFEELDKEKDTK